MIAFGHAKISRRSTVTFTVDVDDWQDCPDAFNIRVSNGYMASGLVNSGDIQIH